ncbi:MAG: alpha/beta fold hydrolase [Bradyrhizobiaceae bacterium]|nr:MAG: alpha/beta fold hydrolase [Bradyrhizobiaceae bacterium]
MGLNSPVVVKASDDTIADQYIRDHDNGLHRHVTDVPRAGDIVPIDQSSKVAAGHVPAEASEPAGFPLDRAFRAAVGQLTGGLSPAALMMAYVDWMSHLAAAPEKRLALSREAFQNMLRLADSATHFSTSGIAPWRTIHPEPQDHRFSEEEWLLPPFNLAAQAFLLGQQWWRDATTGVRGVSHENQAVIEFTARQLLDIFAPSNFVLSNPEVLRKAFETGGGSFAAGFHNWLDDVRDYAARGDTNRQAKTEVGKSVAISPGKVVYRNELIELIQYAPTTATVRPEPILIVPAWIMKYYILDLSPHNSLVKFLTDSGFTVFMISWKNPDPEDRNLTLEDYRELGVHAALSKVRDIVPGEKIHAIGYCLGGTLLSIAVAAMAREHADWIKTVTLLASQVDFTEAGELTLFINESQVAFLEDMMWRRGVLDSRQMAGTFQILRSNDLIWSRLIRNYLMGERDPSSDLMAWSADATRMPYRMHSDYLRKLFLNNDLAEGRYLVDGKPIALSDIHAPIFAVGTTYDHIAPWKSTYKIHFLTDADVTYLLTTGGHNVGIVSPPGATTHTYQVMSKGSDDPYIGPDAWLEIAPHVEGSWWPELAKWLAQHSSEPSSPPAMGGVALKDTVLADAPGDYVLQT